METLEMVAIGFNRSTVGSVGQPGTKFTQPRICALTS
ncbi:hypothetical protein N836_19795 [Leptolyngbya sp. Heron Island J]|nr:hypothetical protein N836_19795 [Leptolyngbya sp. Heron Island J]